MRNRPSVLYPGLWLLLASLAAWMPLSAAAQENLASEIDLKAFRAQRVWKTMLPLRFVDEIRQYYTAGPYLFAHSTDGDLRVVDLIDGQTLWRETVSLPGVGMMPPQLCEVEGLKGFALTLPDKVRFLNRRDGKRLQKINRVSETEVEVKPIGPVNLRTGTYAAAAVSPEFVFALAPRGSIRCYEIATNYAPWQRRMPSLIELSPIHVESLELVVLADETGHVVGLDDDSAATRWGVDLIGDPAGKMVLDGEHAFLATDGPRVYELDLADGDVMLEYRLPARPTGPPLVTRDSIYQATEAGVQRIGKEPEWPNWVVEEARAFLAEWPGRVILLGKNHEILVARIQTGEILTRVPVGKAWHGVPNVYGDPLVLASKQGQVICIRPVEAEHQLTAADFSPETDHKTSSATAGTAAGQPGAAPGPGSEVISVPEPQAPSGSTELTPVEELMADPLKSSRQ